MARDRAVKLQLKLAETLSKKDTDKVIACAESTAKGAVRRLFPESSDAELTTFYVIDAADAKAAEQAIQALKAMKGVEMVSLPAQRSHKGN
jgi:hypothetical protein